MTVISPCSLSGGGTIHPPVMSASPCKVVLANNIAKTLLSEVQAGLQKLGRPPHLRGILANDDPAAVVYADWTARTCTEK